MSKREQESVQVEVTGRDHLGRITTEILPMRVVHLTPEEQAIEDEVAAYLKGIKPPDNSFSRDLAKSCLLMLAMCIGALVLVALYAIR